MKLVQAPQRFSFNYAAYDYSAVLFVAFNIYDISSGSAVFDSQVVGSYSALGNYIGTKTPVVGKTYLVIGIVYTDGTYTTPDPNRAPSVETYQAGAPTNLAFAYGSYDQNAGLFIRASIYNSSSGTPVFNSTVNLALAAFGVYFGVFTGTPGSSYDILSAVYTDGTYSTVNTNRGQAVDDFECVSLSTFITLDGAAVLSAGPYSAILEAN